MVSPDNQRPLKRVVAASITYIVIACVAGAIAVFRNLPAQPLGEGSGTGRPVLQEFLFGNGTAVSPGLSWLGLQAVLTYLATRKDRWGSLGLIVLALHGLLSGVFATTEPMFRRIFSPATFDPLLAVVEIGNVVLPFIMAVFAVLEWRRRRTPW